MHLSILLNTTQYYSICHNQIQHQYYKTYSITTNLHHNTASIQQTYIQYYSILQKSILHNTTPILHRLQHYYINTTPILHQYYINTTSILHQYYINTTRLFTLLLNATFLNTASILPNTTPILHQYYLDFVNTTSILPQYYINTTSILHNGISILQIAISILPQYYIEYFGLQYYPILPILPKFNTTKVVNTTQYYQYYQYY